MNNWYESSTGKGLSMTIGGFSVMGIADALSIIFNYFEVEMSGTDIANMIVGIMTGVGALMTLFGVVRRIVIKATSKI